MIDPRAYQDEAVERALEHDGFALFAEMRTGKTVMSCRIVQRRDPDVLLVACPEKALDVWSSHLQQFGIDCDTQLLTLDSVWSRRKKLKRWIRKAKRPMVIVDESHRIKGRTKKVSKAIRSLGKYAKFRLALTGTPIEGKLVDAWAQMDFVDPELFGSWREFKERYLVFGGFKGYKIIGTRNEDEFRRKLHTRFFRVELEDVKETPTDIAPPNLVTFDLVDSLPMYTEMDLKFMVDLDRARTPVRRKVVDPLTGESTFKEFRRRVVAPRVITQAMKLHQISGGSILDEEGRVHHFGDEKLLHCGALVCALGNVPTVIVVRFIHELHRIGQLIRALGRQVTFISGKHKWIEGTPFDVAVVQVRSGISIDLSRAEELVFYSWNYSGLDYEQTKFRIRSFTGVRARYHYLIARGTIDEDLYKVVTEKLSFASHLINKRRK